MKSRKFLIVVPVILLVSCFILTGASGNEKIYKIWVNTFHFSVNDADFGGLNDGNFMGLKITKNDFEWEKTNNHKNFAPSDFTEEQLFSFFKGMGFGDTEAKEAVDWLVSVNHAVLGARHGNLLYIILK